MKQSLTLVRAALIFIGVMIGLALAGGLVGVAMTSGFDRFAKQSPVGPVVARQNIPPEPRLQVDPLADRRVAAGPERRAATAGPGHIPVEQAMAELAAKGWPEAQP